MTLRWRLTVLYTALLAVLLGAITTSVYAAVYGQLRFRLERDLEANLAQAVGLLPDSLPNSVADRERLEGAFPPTIYGEVDWVFDDDLAAGGFPYPSPSLNGERIRLDDRAYEQLRRESVYRGDTVLEVGGERVPVTVRARYLVNRGNPPDAILAFSGRAVYVARDLRGIENTMRELGNTLFVVSVVGLVAAGVGSYLLAGRALEPIRAVRDAAATITDKSLADRVPEPGTHDEVDALAQTLNRMLARLESAFETQRRFTADASHELRTPVTAIKGHADYLLRRTSPTPAQRESLEIIRSEGERLRTLVGDLLELARADAGLRLELGPVDLKALAEDVHREVAPIAGTTEILVGGPGGLAVRADAARLRQVLLNLVQNAIKAGAGRVRVEARPEGPRARLTVEDDGPGIAAEHLPRLFDRFYRVDTARNREFGGSGLGLSIVKRIVEAHGGAVTVESEVGVGTRFEVVLPL